MPAPASGPRRSRVGAVIAALGAAVLAAWLAFGRTPLQPLDPPPAAPTLTADAHRPAPVASSFAVRIESVPAGADVLEGTTLIGSTPLTVTVTQPPRTFTVRKDGFLPYTIVQDASASDTRVVAELSAQTATIAAIVPPAASSAAAPAPRKPPPAHKPPGPKPAASAGGDIFMQR
jgi:hypothetical protein